MKSIVQILSLTVMLTSCGLGSRNFQKQKFTQLRPLKSSSTLAQSPLKELISFTRLGIEKVKLEDENPKIVSLKEAIASSQTILIHQGDKQFIVNEPVYDALTNSLCGELQEVKNTIKFDSALEFDLDEKVEISKGEGIPLNNLEIREPEITSEDNVVVIDEDKDYVRPSYKERKTWPVLTKAEEKESDQASRAKKFYFLALIAVPVVAATVILMFVTAYAWLFAILAVSAIYFFVMSFIARINIIRYKRKMDRKKKRLRPGMRVLHALLGGSTFDFFR